MQIILSPESTSPLPGPDGSRTEGIFPRFSPRPGDSLHATVIFVSDKAANLKLDTGAIIRASIQGLSTLAEGDRVRFLVNESSGQRILLSPLEIQRPGFGKIFDTGLSASPLPVESLGQDIFQALARTGLSLNPELESRLTELITAYPRLEAELAVLLAANEIPLTAENVLLAELLQKSEIKTDGLIADVLKALTEALQNSQGKAFPSASLPGGTPESGVPNKPAEPGASNTPEAGFPQTGQPSAKTAPGETPASNINIPGGAAPPNAAASENRASGLSEVGAKPASPQVSPPDEGSRETGFDARPLPGTPGGGSASSIPNQAGSPGNIAANQGASPQLRAFAELLNALLPVLSSSDEIGPGGLQAFDPQAIQSLEASLLTELQNAGGGQIKEGLAQLTAKLGLLSSFAAELSGKGKEAAATGLNRLSSLLQFSQSLSSPSYVQLPYLWQGRRETAELFVFRRRKRTIGAPGSDLIVVVGIDTVHLGRMEGKIRLSATGVSLELLCEREGAAALAREHQADLSRALSETGLRILSVRVGPLTRRTTPVSASALLKEEEPDASLRVNLII